MMAEGWQQMKRLFHAAVDLSVGERRAFLAVACADDKLRRLVEELLAAHDQAGTFLDSPALVDADVIARGDCQRLR